MKKIAALIGIILGLTFIIVSLAMQVPGRRINYVPSYINGDAYNYQIEASLRGGEIAGAKAVKAIYMIGGAILLCGSLIALGSVLDKPGKPGARVRELPDL